MTSLRRTIIVWFTLVLGSVGIAATFFAYEFGLSEAGEFMDDQLRQVASLTNGQLGPDSDARALSEPEDHFAIIVWGKDGHILSSTSDSPQGVARPTISGLMTFEVQGVAWRAYVAHNDGRTMMIAQLMSAREEIARHSAVAVAIPIIVVIPLAWCVVFLTVRRVLKRLTHLSESIAARGVGVEDPLSLEGLPLEIRPLVRAMNILIERLQAALRQQRHFIADSAHELRTPLAALRIQIDNLESGVGADTAAATNALQEGITRASTVLNQLLRLARFDGQETRGVAEAVDLADLLSQSVADSVEIAEAHGVDIGLGELGHPIVRSVRADLQLLISNIIDNAIRYTPPDGRVDCAIRCDSAGATIEIADTGPGVAEADIARLTDRFFRAAAQDKIGSGLGLAIVKAIADSQGLNISIQNRPERSGLVVTVRFPTDLLDLPAPAREPRM